MKKFSRKGVLFLAGAMAICAFVLPPVASAASWGPLNTHHTLDSANIGFTSLTGGAGLTSQCSSSSFTARVLSAGDLSISAATFGGLCTQSGAAVGDCTLTTASTGFPWRATAVTTSNIQIHNINIDLRFENMPGAGNSCLANGLPLQITGTLTGGSWTGNVNPRRIDLLNESGLVSHSALGAANPVAVRGEITDTQGTLTVN